MADKKRTGPAVTAAHAAEIIRLLRQPPPRFPLILGLVGPLGCGKTTVADAVAAACGAKRLSCAGPIRDMLAALGVDREAMAKRKSEPLPWLHGKTPRSLMKSLGTEWGRDHVGDDIWVNAVLRQASTSRVPVVIDDIRFDNEAEAVKAAGGHLMYISRPGCTYSWEHPSECGLSDWSQVDAAIGMVTGIVVTSELRAGFYPRRPWWANFRAGRWCIRQWRSVAGSRPAFQENLATPEAIARDVVMTWAALSGVKL